MAAVSVSFGTAVGRDTLLALAKRALDSASQDSAAQYVTVLARALSQEPPPWGTTLYEEMYRAAASDPQWMAMALITGADLKGRRSRDAWAVAEASDDPTDRIRLRAYAVEESRHARVDIALLDVVFPGAIDAGFREQLLSLAPRYRIDDARPPRDEAPVPSHGTFDAVVLLNFDELRGVLIGSIQRPMLVGHCPAAFREQAAAMLDEVLSDDLRHLGLGAEMIDRHLSDHDDGSDDRRFEALMRFFNNACAEQPIDYSYNERFGMYP